MSLKQPTRTRIRLEEPERIWAHRPGGVFCLALLQMGFTELGTSPHPLVVSYTAVSPLPYLCVAARRSVFCGTSLRVTPSGRYPPSCAVEPGLSSKRPAANRWSAARLPGHPASVEYFTAAQRPRFKLKRMLILLPPSEGKTAAPPACAPVNFAELSFPELTAEREAVLEELAAVSAQETALEQLKVGASLAGEVQRNTQLVTEPAHAASETYTGVLFEALGYGDFSAAERQVANRTILISSALWGVVRPHDAIPAYRLSMGVKLGELGSLANWWRGALGVALAPVVAGELVVDCRSAAYAKSWVTPPRQSMTVRVERIADDGARSVVSHMAKHYRGELARYLVHSGLAEQDFEPTPAGAAELVHALEAEWQVECTPPTDKKAGVLTLLIRE